MEANAETAGGGSLYTWTEEVGGNLEVCKSIHLLHWLIKLYAWLGINNIPFRLCNLIFRSTSDNFPMFQKGKWAFEPTEYLEKEFTPNFLVEHIYLCIVKNGHKKYMYKICLFSKFLFFFPLYTQVWNLKTKLFSVFKNNIHDMKIYSFSERTIRRCTRMSEALFKGDFSAESHLLKIYFFLTFFYFLFYF